MNDYRTTTLLDAMWQGHYPRIYDREISAQRWLADYVTTYLQRDVRKITQITNLNTFTSFLKLCAGHTGQEVNFSKLGNDMGLVCSLLGIRSAEELRHHPLRGAIFESRVVPSIVLTLRT